MPGRFVGRGELIERARCVLESRCSPGPIVIIGEPGMGRTAVLTHILGLADASSDEIVRLRPSGDAPLAALRSGFGGALPPSATLDDAVAAISGYAADRRLVIAADDAHLMDHPSVLALREVSRAGAAVVVITRPAVAGLPARPDPTGCLAYEAGLQRLVLLPLGVDEVAAVLASAAGVPVSHATAEAVQLATGGNPRLLHDLVTETRLAGCMVRRGERWGMGVPARAARARGTYSGVAKLVETTRDAWQELAVERADQLCRLALWCGLRDEIAPVWAALLLLQGRAGACIEFLDSVRTESVVTSPQLALIKALALALGPGRVEDMSSVQIGTLGGGSGGGSGGGRSGGSGGGGSGGGGPHVGAAYSAWLLALTGHGSAAAAALRTIERTDPETALFVHAARGALACLGDLHAESVFHLRRALATAEGCKTSCPWMRPYLTAALIDALFRSGRTEEALSAARRFHAHEPGSGWELVVALEALIAGEAGEATDSVAA
jgi:uncharacterized membrane protein YgcG